MISPYAGSGWLPYSNYPMGLSPFGASPFAATIPANSHLQSFDSCGGSSASPEQLQQAVQGMMALQLMFMGGALGALALAQLIMMRANQRQQQGGGANGASPFGASPFGGSQMRGRLPGGQFSRRGPSTRNGWPQSNPLTNGATLPGSVTNQGPATPSEIRQIPYYNELSPAMQRAAVDAVRSGLRVTSTTHGGHARTSNHYARNHADGLGHAIDIAGSPSQLRAFYQKYAQVSPRELFYDPVGGIKRGRNIGPIGGHSDHLHLAL